MKNLKRIAVAVAALAILSVAGVAYANPSFFATGITTNNAASSTPAWLVAGASTSTSPVYDAYAPTAASQHFAADSAGLLIRDAASSSATVFHHAIEYSQDGIDYYQNFVIAPRTFGTTTPSLTLSNFVSLTYPFASTTVQGKAVTNLNSATTTIATTIPTPFRYTRIITWVTGGNGASWVNLVPVKEQL